MGAWMVAGRWADLPREAKISEGLTALKINLAGPYGVGHCAVSRIPVR